MKIRVCVVGCIWDVVSTIEPNVSEITYPNPAYSMFRLRRIGTVSDVVDYLKREYDAQIIGEIEA